MYLLILIAVLLVYACFPSIFQGLLPIIIYQEDFTNVLPSIVSFLSAMLIFLIMSFRYHEKIDSFVKKDKLKSGCTTIILDGLNRIYNSGTNTKNRFSFNALRMRLTLWGLAKYFKVHSNIKLKTKERMENAIYSTFYLISMCIICLLLNKYIISNISLLNCLSLVFVLAFANTLFNYYLYINVFLLPYRYSVESYNKWWEIMMRLAKRSMSTKSYTDIEKLYLQLKQITDYVLDDKPMKLLHPLKDKKKVK